MNFKFTIEDFLSDFGAGFVFIFGLGITNFGLFIPVIDLMVKYKDYNVGIGILLFIIIYIFGLAISAITNFINQDIYAFIHKLIKNINMEKPNLHQKTEKYKLHYLIYFIIHYVINKLLFFLKNLTLLLFFRYWSSTETIIRLRRKIRMLDENKNVMPGGLEYLLNFSEKTVLEGVYTMGKKYSKELNSTKMHYWFKSQFWELFSSSIFFLFIVNTFIINNNITLLSAIIYIVVFFTGKFLGRMYVKMYLKEISRESNIRKK